MLISPKFEYEMGFLGLSLTQYVQASLSFKFYAYSKSEITLCGYYKSLVLEHITAYSWKSMKLMCLQISTYSTIVLKVL